MNNLTTTTPDPEEPRNLPVVQNQNMAVGAALGVNEILAQVRLIQQVMGQVMKEGEHYGTIPGCGDRKTLLQPGAQKLTMTFRLAPRYEIQETNFPGGHKEYRVICTLASITSGTFVGQGVGCCSTLEAKYRYRGGARKCPECGKEAIIKGKKEYGGGWLCFQKKGGCGAKWPDGAAAIESQSIERVENDNPADFFNTVLKMAKKRSFVDATITATAASDIFTQDIGDDESGDNSEEKVAPPAAPAPRPAPSPHSAPPRAPSAPRSSAPLAGATPVAGSSALSKDAETFGEACKKKLLELASRSHPHLWWKYAVDQGWMLSTEPLSMIKASTVFGIKPTQDRATNKAASEIAFKKLSQGVEAMASTVDLAMDAEIKTAYQAANASEPAVAGPPTPKPSLPTANMFNCPNCQGSATKPNEDHEGIQWCQKCGYQWELASRGKEWEAHPWMMVLCPVPPKGTMKKDYTPISLGQMMRTDGDRAYGFYMNNTVAKAGKGWTNKAGKAFPASQEDLDFAQACEDAKAHIESKKSDGKPDEEEDIPF